uniref:Uncharacterized protein n=1 Tax=Medicago truncatula TaxID=3880 RepID=A2Q4S7_MEDTR|nr:hypothetical protein MtrDRAFT_AC157777g27v2 [Medicago truncatula]
MGNNFGAPTLKSNKKIEELSKRRNHGNSSWQGGLDGCGSAPNNLNNNLRITFYMKKSNTLVKGELKTQVMTPKINKNDITVKSFDKVAKKITN